MSTSCGLIIEFSRNEKLQLSRESFCLSILTIYTNDWFPFWHVYCCHVYFFFCKIPKYVQARNGLAHLDWHFIEWASMLTKQAGDDECRLSRFHRIRNFLANEILSFFKAVPSNRLAFYLASPLHVISSSFSHVCFFQNAILHKMLKLGFWNFKPIFLRIQFSLVGKNFFSSFGDLLGHSHMTCVTYRRIFLRENHPKI